MLQLARFIALLWRYRRQGRPRAQVVRTPFKVRWLDSDSYLHMTNSRYLSIMDIARTDWLFRVGMLPELRRTKLKPVVVEVNIRYRRELKPGQRYEVETKALRLASRKLVLTQNFYIGDKLHAESEVGLLFLKGKRAADAASVQDLLAPLNLGLALGELASAAA